MQPRITVHHVSKECSQILQVLFLAKCMNLWLWLFISHNPFKMWHSVTYVSTLQYLVAKESMWDSLKLLETLTYCICMPDIPCKGTATTACLCSYFCDFSTLHCLNNRPEIVSTYYEVTGNRVLVASYQRLTCLWVFSL